MSNQSRDKNKLRVESAPDLSTRLALRQDEAAAALGIAVSTLREIGSDMPHVRRGRLLLYPVAALRQWLEDQSEARESDVEGIVADILGDSCR